MILSVHVLELGGANGTEGLIIAVDGFFANRLHRAGFVEDDKVVNLGLEGVVLLFHCYVCFEFWYKGIGGLSHFLVQVENSLRKCVILDSIGKSVGIKMIKAKSTSKL